MNTQHNQPNTTPPTSPTPIQPAQPHTPPTTPPTPAAPVPPPPTTRNLPEPPKNTGLFATLGIVSVLMVIFAGLFVWQFFAHQDLKGNFDAKLNASIETERAKTSKELEAHYLERQKSPSKTFTGPEDYGSLSFEYPKTWSVYIHKDINSSGGDFEAYFNPGEVNPVSEQTINSLRVIIRSRKMEDVIRSYESGLKKGEITMSAININGVNANLYKGKITRDLTGSVVVFKLRDKTVSIQTDAQIFESDFQNLLKSVTFNS